jgi:hypothetical protein
MWAKSPMMQTLKGRQGIFQPFMTNGTKLCLITSLATFLLEPSPWFLFSTFIEKAK